MAIRRRDEPLVGEQTGPRQAKEAARSFPAGAECIQKERRVLVARFVDVISITIRKASVSEYSWQPAPYIRRYRGDFFKIPKSE